MNKVLQLLFNQFVKQYGRKPNNLESILLKQKAMKEALDKRKVISMVDRQPIDPNKPIMGGQQSGMFDNIFNKMQKERKGLTSIGEDLPPPGSRGGKDDIAAPVQSQEETLRNMTEAEIKKNIEAQNKKGIESLKKKLDDDPEKKADGGRIGLKDGMNRRTFMKVFSGLVALPIIGKVLKPFKVGKTVTKVPIIKTDNVPGKPEWFDALVNKVIIQGDDVTKKFATKEREIVHAKQIDEDNYVTVTQDLDEGVVRVEYESPTTMFGEKVDMTYKKPLPDEDVPRPQGEFQTEESGIVGRAQGPDDYDLEIEGMSGRAIEDLESDVSKLKEYATGKGPTMKEIVQNKKRRDKVRYYETPEGQSEYVVQRQGEADDYYTDVDDFASGGIAGMLGE